MYTSENKLNRLVYFQLCELPNELIYNIVKFLKDDDLCNLYIVNNLFNIIIDCDLEK